MIEPEEDQLPPITDRVAIRALGLGAFAGTAVGYLTPAFVWVLFDGWGLLLPALVVGIVGAVGGAFTGLACALLPALVFSSWPEYFRRHVWHARVCAGAIAGALTIALSVHAFVTTSGYKAAIGFAVPMGAATLLGTHYARCALANPRDIRRAAWKPGP